MPACTRRAAGESIPAANRLRSAGAGADQTVASCFRFAVLRAARLPAAGEPGNTVSAAQGLGDRTGRLGDLFQEIMGIIPAVDVPGCYLRPLDAFPAEFERCAVIPERADARDAAGRVLVDDEDLARPLARRAGLLPV